MTISKHTWNPTDHTDLHTERLHIDCEASLSELKVNSAPDLLLLDILQLNNRAMRYLQEGHLSSPLLFTNSFKHTSNRKIEQQDALPSKLQHVQLAKSLLHLDVQPAEAPAPMGYRTGRQCQALF